MAISYEEALATLEAMFGGYSSQQLDAVLRHHGGHMEHTVETLLGHGEGTPEELMQKLPNIPVGGAPAPPSNAGGGHDIDADEELARQLAAEDERGAVRRQQQQQGRGLGLASAMGANRGPPPGQRRPMSSTVTAPARPPAARPAAPKPPAGTKGRGTPTTLPVDFLRIPGRKYPASSATATNASDPIASATGPGGMGQMMTDEQLARMLQDELFQEELRNNPEFSHLAWRRNPRSSSGRAAGQSTGRSTYSGAGGPDFFDRLSELGDNAKRRFQELAANWNDPNPNRQTRPLFGGGAPSGAPSRGNERRGLLSNDLDMDEEEEEMEFVGSGSGSGRDFEMNDVGGSGDKKKD